MTPGRTSVRMLVAGWPWLMALLVTAPLLAPGFVLSYDMVFVPRQDLLPESLGLGGPLPRAVPSDALVAVATSVVPGQLLQKVVLVGLLGAAGWGAARLVPSASIVARLAASSWYVWNPFVAERLVIGHWALLVGYAALPWLVRAAIDLRRGVPGAQLRLVTFLVPTALTPSGGMIALLTVLPLLAVGRSRATWRALLVTLGSWVLLNAPWWLPGVLHPTSGTSTPAAVDAFAMRAEGILGTVGTALSLGGVWNADVAPDSRELAVAALFLAVVLGVAAFGIHPLRRSWGAAATGMAVAAGVGLVVALAGSLPITSDAVAWVIGSVPGGGLLRDGQKYLAPLAVLESVAFALGAERLAAARPARAALAVSVCFVVVPLLAMPDFAWGVANRLAPVSYPDDWSAVRRMLQEDPGEGLVAAVPWQSFRQFPWNQGRVVLDPAPRWLPVSTVVDDTLVVDGVAVSGEDPRASRVGEALASDDPGGEALADSGVGWVLVERTTPGEVPEQLLMSGETVYRGDELSLIRLPAAAPVERPAWAPLVVAVDVVVAMFAIATMLGAVLRNRSLRRSARC